MKSGAKGPEKLFRSVFFCGTKYMANDDLLEPPRCADSKNAIALPASPKGKGAPDTHNPLSMMQQPDVPACPPHPPHPTHTATNHTHRWEKGEQDPPVPCTGSTPCPEHRHKNGISCARALPWVPWGPPIVCRYSQAAQSSGQAGKDAATNQPLHEALPPPPPQKLKTCPPIPADLKPHSAVVNDVSSLDQGRATGTVF